MYMYIYIYMYIYKHTHTHIFNRYSHSAAPNLDDWMFGGLQVWRMDSNYQIMI